MTLTKLQDIRDQVAIEQAATQQQKTPAPHFSCRFTIREGVAHSVLARGWAYHKDEPYAYYEATVIDPRTGESYTLANIYHGLAGALAACLYVHQCLKRDVVSLTAEELDAVKQCVSRNANESMQISRHNARVGCGWGASDLDDAGDALAVSTRSDRFDPV